MTTTTKKIWQVTIENGLTSGKSVNQYAANSLKELLSYFNDDAQKRITEIKKVEQEITYQF
jgi:hypothetical protein